MRVFFPKKHIGPFYLRGILHIVRQGGILKFMTKALKLTAELVPQTSWYNNMRSAFPAVTWDRIRKNVYAQHQYRCGICDAEGRLSCHEIWEYEDASYRQALRGFIALCDWCHHVKHLGLAGILASEGRLDYERVVRHFMQVNGCDRAVFDKHHREAMAQWVERSRHPWQVDLGEYQSQVAPRRG